jgi:hypothetical protein
MNQNSSTLETDRLKHDSPAAYVIAQQYSSVIFICMFLHSRKEKSGALFNKKK